MAEKEKETYTNRERYLIYEAASHMNDALLSFRFCNPERYEYQEIMKKTKWTDTAMERPKVIPRGFR